MHRLFPFTTLICSLACGAAPIALHPDNPHYFIFRTKPAVLITAGEHYGAVLNLDFDYAGYLDELKAHGFNLTRIFSGAYREVAGSFGIVGNTLAPSAGRFICPWQRTHAAGASDGGNKFDLTAWDAKYFERLKDFVKEAGQRGIVVELVLFCTMYDDTVWAASPMNAQNNVNGIGKVGRGEVYSGKDAKLLEAQREMVRKIVREMNAFENLYYEVCNEPYERGGLTREWNDHIINAIVETETPLSAKHLAAQGFPPSGSAIKDLNPHVAVVNFHGAKPQSITLNYHLNKALAFDETGGSDRSDRKYRTEGWQWIMAGGSVYDHLDFSFTSEHEDGRAVPLPAGTPGGGGPELRKQLAILKRFIEGFDFVRMAPDTNMVRSHRTEGGTWAGSKEAGKSSVYALSNPGKAYAIYVGGGARAELIVSPPSGRYRAKWLDTKTGKVIKRQTFTSAGSSQSLSSPEYSEDIALEIRLESSL
jgi:hypothetical protein